MEQIVSRLHTARLKTLQVNAFANIGYVRILQCELTNGIETIKQKQCPNLTLLSRLDIFHATFSQISELYQVVFSRSFFFLKDTIHSIFKFTNISCIVLICGLRRTDYFLHFLIPFCFNTEGVILLVNYYYLLRKLYAFFSK